MKEGPLAVPVARTNPSVPKHVPPPPPKPATKDAEGPVKSSAKPAQGTETTASDGIVAENNCLPNAMAGQVGRAADDPISPHLVSCLFIQQYYHALHKQPEQVHKFYQDSSILGRPEPNGNMETVTTLTLIKKKIMSMDFKKYIIEIKTADAQLSHNDGVLINVTGSLTPSEGTCRRFTQSFFLAPQQSGGYFILNDVLRYIDEDKGVELEEQILDFPEDKGVELEEQISDFLRRDKVELGGLLFESEAAKANSETELQRRILAFLQGYKLNGEIFYQKTPMDMLQSKFDKLYVFYEHIKDYDPDLAHVVRLFYSSIEQYFKRAMWILLHADCNCPLPQLPSIQLQICDIPSPKGFRPLQQFWNTHANKPSEVEELWCRDATLAVTKMTPAGRIPLLKLLNKLFDSHARGHTWNGNWSFRHLMINDDLDVEIFRPYARKFKFKGIIRDFKRVIVEVLPKFSCGGQFPAFYCHMAANLSEYFTGQTSLTRDRWKKFHKFVITHLFLKPPLVRSAFFDDLHEVLQSVGKKARDLFSAILRGRAHADEWVHLIQDEAIHPVIAFVYQFNKKKKERDTDRDKRKSKETKNEESVAVDLETTLRNIVHNFHGASNEPAEKEQKSGSEPLGSPHREEKERHRKKRARDEKFQRKQQKQTEEKQLKGQNEQPDPLMEVFEATLYGLLLLTRHVKQHGTRGSLDSLHGEQHIKKLSQIDLILSHYIDALPEIHAAVVFDIDSQGDFFGPCEHEELFRMLNEIMEIYNNSDIIVSEAESFRLEAAVMWANIYSDADESMQNLDEYFLYHKYASGHEVSENDFIVFDALSPTISSRFSNLKRWYNEIAALKTQIGQVGRPANGPINPHLVSCVFIQQYYHILHEQPEQGHKFYQDSSILGWPEPNGSMNFITTLTAIKRKIMFMDFKEYVIEIKTVDAQLSHNDGVLINVTGSLTPSEGTCRIFTQSFFLAPQQSGGYFVLSDVLHFISESQLTDTAAENSMNSDHVTVENNVTDRQFVNPSVTTEPPVQVAKEDPKRAPVAARPPPAPAHRDVTKKSYASIVKDMKQGPLAVPVAKTSPSIHKHKPPKPVSNDSETTASDGVVAENNCLPYENRYSVFVRNLPFHANMNDGENYNPNMNHRSPYPSFFPQ